MKFAVEQDAYAGPFPVLLELLESRELSISSLSLGRIAEDFASYLDTHEISSDELADFLLVSSKLIYLKTKELMPYLVVEEEEDAVDLANQMRLYQAFTLYAEGIQEVFSSPEYAHSRPYKKRNVVLESVSTHLDSAQLEGAFQKLLERNKPFFLLKQTNIERVETVNERMKSLSQAIQARAKMGFKDIISGAGSKADVVVSFLALLELLKSRIVTATQGENHDIIIERV